VGLAAATALGPIWTDSQICSVTRFSGIAEGSRVNSATVERMLAWQHHSGFNVHRGTELDSEDAEGANGFPAVRCSACGMRCECPGVAMRRLLPILRSAPCDEFGVLVDGSLLEEVPTDMSPSRFLRCSAHIPGSVLGSHAQRAPSLDGLGC